MAEKKVSEIETLILQLLGEVQEVSIRSIASAAGFTEEDPTKRKAIRRALLSLENRHAVEPKGAGRSRVYVRPQTASAGITVASSATTSERDGLKDILLSIEAKSLLRSISRSLRVRKPVGFNQDFLRGYIPNETLYLSAKTKKQLLTVGRVEVQKRPAGTYARDILSRLLIDLSWNSSRLEGNTYSLLETKRLIELGEAASGKDASETQMILNHKAAIEYIVESSSENTISSHEVRSIHALLSENLLGDPSASGRLRTIAVGISGTTYLPLDNPHVLRECFDTFIEKFNQIEDPFEQSFFALVHLSYMQAFEDVNKRTVRIVANIPLIKNNLRPLSFVDVDQGAYVKALLGVYERNDVSLMRDFYLWAYPRSSQKYSAIQQAMGEPNLLKLKYRAQILDIIRTIVLEMVEGSQVVSRIQRLIHVHNLPVTDYTELFKVIETEIMSLHDGNFARFKITPREFQSWKAQQNRMGI